jgi:hypothetical protein
MLIEKKLATEEKYKLKDFARWANKEGISNELLKAVVSEMNRGLLGDRLGAHIYKKRIGVDGRGKRGGARIIVLFKAKELTLFIYGYLKNDQADISPNEEKQLRIFANYFLNTSAKERLGLIAKGRLLEIE